MVYQRGLDSYNFLKNYRLSARGWANQWNQTCLGSNLNKIHVSIPSYILLSPKIILLLKFPTMLSFDPFGMLTII